MDTAPLSSEISKLTAKISQNNLPPDLAEQLNLRLQRLDRVAKSVGFSSEFDREIKQIDFVASLPFQHSSQDILDLNRATQILETNHYGLKSAKERILEYLAILILNSRQRGTPLRSQALFLVGLAGSGKTSLAYSIAESLGRQVIRIPFGGLGSVSQLRGEYYSRAEAEPGLLLKAIARLGVNNPVILLDEIDRVASESRADIMGVLVELLDPEQNFAFVDHYVDFPFDLSRALFIATANNSANVATAVLDRLETIEMPSYSDEEKIIIGKRYLLPRALKEAGLPSSALAIDDAIWPQIVRPLGFDAGIRSLQRHIQTLVRRVAKGVVEGKSGPYKLTIANLGEYLG